jgi:uncharacterized iron-regulated protein
LEEGVDFRVYRSDGAPATLADIVREAGRVDAVMIGEEHTDFMTHRLQAEIFRDVFISHGGRGEAARLPEGHPPMGGNAGDPSAAGRSVVLTLEMFERDVQYILDEYLADLITEDQFKRSARPWPRYDRDYRPLVEFAKTHRIPVVAANAPRRYVNRASRLGKESLLDLSPEALAFLPPLPYPAASEAYVAEWDALMGDAARHMTGSPLDAQTLWDAAMAHSIAGVLDETEGALVVHLAGSFHVANGTGTPEALEHYRPGTRVMIVTADPVSDPSVFDPEEHGGLGDFVILTLEPEDEAAGPPQG